MCAFIERGSVMHAIALRFLHGFRSPVSRLLFEYIATEIITAVNVLLLADMSVDVVKAKEGKGTWSVCARALGVLSRALDGRTAERC